MQTQTNFLFDKLKLLLLFSIVLVDSARFRRGNMTLSFLGFWLEFFVSLSFSFIHYHLRKQRYEMAKKQFNIKSGLYFKIYHFPNV